MRLIKLNDDTLAKVATLIGNPSGLLPLALKTLAPNAPWDLLTQKVGSNLAKTGQAEFALPLLGASATQDGALSGDWTWSASVEANASLAMDLLTDDDLQALPLRPDAQHTLIVYGGSVAVGGKLGADAGNLPWGQFGIGISGKRSASLRWYVQAKDDAFLLDALVAAQRHFVWPHDIAGMLRMAGRTDWHGLAVELSGEAQLAIDVDAVAQAAGWTFSLHGDTSTVGLSFGVKAGFRASRKSRWTLSAMVEPRLSPGGATVLGVRVKLHDLDQSRRSTSLEIAAGADFSAVAASAERALRAAWPELQHSPQLDALTQPGTAIADTLRGLIDKKLDGPLQPLAGLLVGGKPTAALRKSLVDKLTFGLADTLDGALADLASGQAKADKAAAGWLDQLFGKAAALVTLDDDIKAVVSDALAQAGAGLQGAIGTLKAQIVGKAGSQVDALLKRLGELGAQFDAKLDQLDDDRATKAIGAALARYAALRDKLLAVLTDSHRQKLMLTLAASAARDTASEAAFEAWFSPAEAAAPEAEQLFNALYSGRLLALPQLVLAAAATGAVADAKGWLLSTSKTMEQQRVTLNFFGVEIGSSSTWLRDVTVKTDLVTGTLLAAKAGASVGTAIVNPWKNRSARLGLQLDLAGGDGAARQFAATLEGAFTAQQESTDRAGVQQLLNAYADATGAQQCDIGALLDVPADSDSARRFWKSLTIAVPVALDAQQWAAFAALDAATIERESLQAALAQFERRYAGDSLFSKDPLRDLRRLVLETVNEKKADDATILRYLKLYPTTHVKPTGALGDTVGIAVKDSVSFSPGARLFKAYHRLSATVQAPLRLRDLAADATGRLQALPAPTDPTALRKALDPVMARMQQALAPVALVSETWLGLGFLGAKDEAVAWPFASFVTTMARLAGLPVPPGFVPIAQVGEQPPVRLIAA